MRTIKIRLSFLITLILIMVTVACVPTNYKKPVDNFKNATNDSKKIYFTQLQKTHKSFSARHELKLKLDMLLTKNYDYQSENYILQKEKIFQLNNSKDIPETSLKLRNSAFEILDYYSKMLQALSSDEKTDALKDELSGFSKDTKKMLASVSNLSDISESFTFLKPVADWAGPLGSAVGALNGIVDLISNYFRERAIKKAIIQADPMVRELLTLLGDEAVNAADFRENNYNEMVRECRMTLEDMEISEAASQYLIYNICNEVELEQTKVIDPKELKEAFALVIEAHAEMTKMAEGGDFKIMVEKIRHFQQRLNHIKTKFDLVIY